MKTATQVIELLVEMHPCLAIVEREHLNDPGHSNWDDRTSNAKLTVSGFPYTAARQKWSAMLEGLLHDLRVDVECVYPSMDDDGRSVNVYYTEGLNNVGMF